MTRVAIADDHAVVRAGLRALVSSDSGLELVGEAAGGYEAIEMVERENPDVLVLDLSMPDLDGIEVTRALRARLPGVSILILTVHEDEALLREAIKAGASGYILKRAAESELVSAIGVVRRGDLYVDPAMMRSVLSDLTGQPSPSSAPADVLTAREKDVLRLIAQGYTNPQIGQELGISVRTVEGHRANLLEKLDLRSRVDLVRYARQHGLAP